MALPELDPISVSASLSAPDVTELTTGSVDGTGVFDTLMQSAKEHLLEEYNANRISGAEYTTVYLGMMQATMQQSVAFILNHYQKEKVSAEIGLIRQQTVTELTQTDDDIPVGLGFNDTAAVEGLVKSKKDLEAQQILNAVKQEDLTDKQIEAADAQIQLTNQQTITELAQTDDTLGTAALALGLNGTATIEGLVASQKNKVVAEVSFTEARTTSETSLQAKVDQETILLAQKTITELAQTSDAVVTSTPALNTSVTLGGTVAKQNALFAAQTDGFARDAEQKLAKMMLDTWSVRATTDGATADTVNKLDDSNIGAVITKAKAGIGVA